MMKYLHYPTIIGVVLGLLAPVGASEWHDDFTDFALNDSAYQAVKTTTGVVDVQESSDFGGQLEVKTNSPGGSYALAAVQVQPGETVRTVMTQFDAWNDYSVSAIGLAYTLSYQRLLDVSSAAFYIQHRRSNVMAYRHVNTDEQSIELPGVGDPYLQETWIYEMQLGPDLGSGVFDVTLSVYDLNGVQRGSSVTMRTSTPTGRLYWYVGDNRTIDYIHRLDIATTLPPPGPATCEDVRRMGHRIPVDINRDCRVGLPDLALVAQQWLACGDPQRQGCAAPPKVTFDDQKRSLIDAEPFFPLGIYLGPTTDEHLARIAEAGFNMVVAYNYGRDISTEEARDYLDRVHRHGLKTFYSLYMHYTFMPGFPIDEWSSGAEMAKMLHVRPLRSHPALLGWYINDEMLPNPNRQPALIEMYNMLKVEDPHHPALSVTHRPAESDYFYNVTDIMAPDPYPVDNEPLTKVGDWVDLVHAGMQNVKPVWVVPQLHALDIYTEDPTDRAPNLAEMRNMAYLGLIHRATGLLFYSYRELWRSEQADNQTWAQFEPRWNDVRTMAQELAQLLPALERGAEWIVSVTPSGSAVELCGFQHEDKYHLLAANPSYDLPAAEVQVALPVGQWCVGGQLGNDIDAEIVGSNLELLVPPLGSGVVIIEPTP